MKIIIFRGDVTDMPAKKEALMNMSQLRGDLTNVWATKKALVKLRW